MNQLRRYSVEREDDLILLAIEGLGTIEVPPREAIDLAAKLMALATAIKANQVPAAEPDNPDPAVPSAN